MMLYKYIFCKTYYFAIKIFRENEFPWAFASIMVTVCLVTSILVILEAIEYIMLPKKINTYGEYHGYFAVLLCIVIQIYVRRKNKYLEILEECKNISIGKQKLMNYLSVAYILIILISFFMLGDLIREYNLR